MVITCKIIALFLWIALHVSCYYTVHLLIPLQGFVNSISMSQNSKGQILQILVLEVQVEVMQI